MAYPPGAAALHAKMLKKKLWVVITKAVAPREALDRLLEAHLNHQIRLERKASCSAPGR